jgi:hypothetical protein
MEARARRRVRLSMACNACRRRKVKCDAQQPRCRHCSIRNEECRTFSTRKPDQEVLRQWLEGPEAVEASGSLENADETGSILDAQDVAVNKDARTRRVKMMGLSSPQSLVKSLDLYLKRADGQPISGIFVHGMKHAEEMHLDNAYQWMKLPDLASLDSYIDSFSRHVHTVYTILDLDDARSNSAWLLSSQDVSSIGQSELPMLMIVYLIVSIGADEAAGGYTQEGADYLQAAAHLLGQVIFVPYLPTVQSLLLLAIAYRGREQGGLSWQMLGIALRIAQSLGLHQTYAGNHELSIRLHDGNISMQVWNTITTLERIMQLECGRPSLLHEPRLGKTLTLHLGQGPDCVSMLSAVSKIQSYVSELVYSGPRSSRNTQDFLEQLIILDRALLDLGDQAPSKFKADSLLVCKDKDAISIAHVMIQYHVTMITLHRVALVAPKASYQALIARHIPDGIARERLCEGEAICAASAQYIARMTAELADAAVCSNILTADGPLLACIALAIYLIKGCGKLSRNRNYEVSTYRPTFRWL